MWIIRQLVRGTVKGIGSYRQAITAGKNHRGFSRTAAAAAAAARQDTLVIFDKDGTLVTFEDSWIDWTINMTEKYAQKVQKPIHDELYKMMGFNAETKRFSDGLICDTDENIIKSLSSYLQTQGLKPDEATEFVESNYFCYKTSSHVSVPVDNPRELFTELRKHGVKIAVCTSDSSPGKDAMVKDLHLQGLIDFSLCGNEPEMKPKPHPDNIDYICKKVGVAPSNTIMVGDSLRDMEMGQAANVRLSVGVLSGVCDEEHLRDVADVVVPSIKHILPLAVPGYKQ